jgi:hypothetical protein
MGREKQFSYEAQKALFDYLEDLEESMEEKFELDVIALCCEYAEIEEDDREYSQYVGDNADCEDDIIATLPLSVLVRVS